MENFVTQILYPVCAVFCTLSLFVIAVNTGKKK